MPADTPSPHRASTYLGRRVYDPDGRYLGRIADLETRRDAAGREQVVAAVVTRGPWGRLLGYERDRGAGPWLLEIFARHVIRRDTRRIPWSEIPL
ncbi:PRC-barrel domain containing protein [Actinoplanes oblitus]|uniref:PRC-barrel domain containing protein n=1 Tax=Actinoplanes oblitus TaxID=3040509 RepID=A0ABY8W599_9ACTN|nr:PRC-barrel domain containing protein [Actinoplanes oblitus]WIM93024.1 PRC-barrel domain containing protein [Actinoplanes oblitus]